MVTASPPPVKKNSFKILPNFLYVLFETEIDAVFFSWFGDQQLSVKSFVTSRRNCAMLPWTLNRKWPLLLPPPLWRNPMNCPTVRYDELPSLDLWPAIRHVGHGRGCNDRLLLLMHRSSPSATSDSVAPRPSSSPHSWVWNLAVSTRPSTTRS